MKKEDVFWHEEDEYTVMEDEGWKLICVMNHYKGRFHYEVKTPDNYYLNYMNTDICETIDFLNKMKTGVDNE